ncbi:MAG: MFS transporter [Anaerolineae bacterium]|nr:MFS transporter [Anaerolineae bacterium]MCB9108921.1 MFS transporter [Anaerolineales bacterium]
MQKTEFSVDADYQKTEPKPKENAVLNVLSLRDFRLLFVGVSTSLLGDQFALIATPWLVLQLTGDPLALGIVLALEGIPRALFMLFGGAITDRFSPRIVMLASDIVRFVLTTLMTIVIFTGAVQMWMLYAFGLGFGLVAGFAVPAGNSIVPRLVKEKDLQAGNSIIMGVGQLVGFIGPVVAGVLIGQFSQSFLGIGLAFGIDAATFAVSAVVLGLMRSGGKLPSSTEVPDKENIWAAIAAGLKYLWNDEALRLIFLVIAAVNFLFVGPILVGVPVLADQRLAEGALAFGLLMSGFAGGNLGGFLLAGALPRPSGRTIRLLLIALLAVFGIAMGVMGFINLTWIDFGLMLLLGLGTGYITLILFTWIQTRTPQTMLGRMMSLLMLASAGLIPVSQAISGAVGAWNLTLLLVSAGGMIVVFSIWITFQPALVTFSESLSTNN